MHAEIIALIQDRTLETSLRLEAILALAQDFQPDTDYPLLSSLLNDETEPEDVRSAVALTLGKVGRTEEVLPLLAAQWDTDSITLKNYLIQALGMLGEAECAPLLIEALKHPNNNIFASAAEALGQLGPGVVPHLVALLENGAADDARCVAAWQLGTVGGRDALPSLVKTVAEDPNIEVVALAIWALGEIGVRTPEAIAVLEQARLKPEPEVRLRAELALKKIARHGN
jgi:HEAT repeat protein